MITHKSEAIHINTTEFNSNRVTTVMLEVPYSDLLSWFESITGILNVYPKSYQEDFNDVNISPWEPEQWDTSKNTVGGLPYQLDYSCSMVWEQLSKAVAVGASGLHNMNIHDDLVRRLFLPFIGRKVLVTFSKSEKLLKKLILPESEQYEWHLPFISKEERKLNDNHFNICVSVYRCAQGGKPKKEKINEQMEEGNKLIENKTPFMKHILRSYTGSGFKSNLNGWVGLDELIRNQVHW